METNTPKPSSRPVISPLAPEMQSQSAAVWRLNTNPNTSNEITIAIPESGMLNIFYQVQYGNAAGVSVQVWLPTVNEILEPGKLYQFQVEPGAVISLMYSQEYDQVNLQYFVAPK